MANDGTEYQDPLSPGSLSQALQMWLASRRHGVEAAPSHLSFVISCPSESRAERVERFLRRRVACDTTNVRHVVTAHGDAWHVHGTTRIEVQSLRGLERLSTWLRRAASSHQVHLLHLDLVEAAA